MDRPLVFEQQEIDSREVQHHAHGRIAHQNELHEAESEQSEKSHPSIQHQHHQNREEDHDPHHPHNVNQRQRHETAQKQRPRRPEAKLVTEGEQNSSNDGEKAKGERKHELLPPEVPRQRKQSSSFEEKADLFHWAQPGEMKPNLLAPEEAASPTHKRNDHFTLKPHQEHKPEYQPHDQHVRTHQLHQQEHHDPRTYKVSNEYEQPQNTHQRRKAKKLPAIDAQNSGDRYQSNTKNPIKIIDSSAILLTTEAKPSKHHFIESFDHLEQEVVDNSLQSIMRPLGSHSAFIFSRDNSCGNYIHPDYQILTLDENPLISAKKQYCHLNSYYTLSSGQQEVGFIRGNFGGSEFNLYQLQSAHEEPHLVATIIYKTNCPCLRPDYRSVAVYLKIARQMDPVFEKEAARKNLKQLFEEEGYTKEIEKLVSKQPSWNEKSSCFVMNFGGKGRLPSVKNMILQSENSHKGHSLLFCKTSKNIFHLQIAHSMSVFVAMGILMSSFDFKLLCQ